jgi:hypothetical protein
VRFSSLAVLFNCGNFAMFAAIRRASSRVSSLAADHRYYGIVNRGGGSPANHCNGQFRADGK